MITYPGRAPSVLEARLIKDAFFKMVDGDVVIHHISEDSTKRLQVEYEVRWFTGENTKCTFHRKIFGY